MTTFPVRSLHVLFLVLTICLLTGACSRSEKPAPTAADTTDISQRTVRLSYHGIRLGDVFHKDRWAATHNARFTVTPEGTQNDSTLKFQFYEYRKNLRVNILTLRDTTVYKIEVYLYDEVNDSLWQAVHHEMGDTLYTNRLMSDVFIQKHIWAFRNQTFTAMKNTHTGWEMMKFTYEDNDLSQRARKGKVDNTSVMRHS